MALLHHINAGTRTVAVLASIRFPSWTVVYKRIAKAPAATPTAVPAANEVQSFTMMMLKCASVCGNEAEAKRNEANLSDWIVHDVLTLTSSNTRQGSVSRYRAFAIRQAIVVK